MTPSPWNRHPGPGRKLVSSTLFTLDLKALCSSDTDFNALWLSDKESACNVGDLGSVPEWGRPPGGGNGNPLQYSGLENSMDRGTWQATVHRVTESDTAECLTHTYTNLLLAPRVSSSAWNGFPTFMGSPFSSLKRKSLLVPPLQVLPQASHHLELLCLMTLSSDSVTLTCHDGALSFCIPSHKTAPYTPSVCREHSLMDH